MKYYVTVGEQTFEVDLTHETPLVDGVPMPVEMSSVPGSRLRHLSANGESITLLAQEAGNRGRWRINIENQVILVDAVDERTRAIREMTGDEPDMQDREVVAPMPGMIMKVEVEVGESVAVGQGVVIMEAMKMENELRAPANGVVARIMVKAGDTVEKGALLLSLE